MYHVKRLAIAANLPVLFGRLTYWTNCRLAKSPFAISTFEQNK